MFQKEDFQPYSKEFFLIGLQTCPGQSLKAHIIARMRGINKNSYGYKEHSNDKQHKGHYDNPQYHLFLLQSKKEHAANAMMPVMTNVKISGSSEQFTMKAGADIPKKAKP